MGNKILVLGGYGTFGRRISQSLAKIPSVECVIGGHNLPKAGQTADVNIPAIKVNVYDPASLRRAMDGVFAVVNTVGPFQERDYTIAETCAGMGIHYVDLADARTYVEGITRLQRRATNKNCLLVSGASAVPAVSAALVDSIVSEFDRINEINICISPGNKNTYGMASVRALLSYTGSPLRIKENGRWRYGYGWSESQVVSFPKPVGRRRVYLCDVPDLDLFPARYGAQTVTFRAGTELKLFNYGLAVLARSRRSGLIKNLPGWARGLNAARLLFRGFGSSSGGMQIRVAGRKNGNELAHTLSLIVRDENGAAISCSPAVSLIRKWVGQGVPECGAMPCVGLLTWEEIKAEMIDYNITLVRV
jgi:hypothetical protein